MATLQKTVVHAEVGPLQRQNGAVYVHEVALDGDENLAMGSRVDIVDVGGEHFSGEVTDIEATGHGPLYEITFDR